MLSFSEISALIRKEILVEFREKYALGGILLYVATSVFIVMIAFGELSAETWNLVYWILFLFASINAMLKSFVRESDHRYLFYYTLTHPVNLLFSKVLYNTGLLLLIGCLLAAALVFIAGNPVQSVEVFIFAILMGSFSLSLTFTFISSIAIKADNSATLLAILGFPLTIPIFINLIDLTAVALGLSMDSNISDEITILGSIELLLIGAGMILFPFLWRS